MTLWRQTNNKLTMPQWCPSTKHMIPVQSWNSGQRNNQYTFGVFSSMGCPFDDRRPVYIGLNPDPTPESI